MLDRLRFLFLTVLLLPAHANAQEVLVTGRFQTDSIKIGIIFPYSLTAAYPKHKTIVFPDSTFAFEPFEIHHKKYFPTKTVENTSYDSVVYYLTSFEIDSIQRLSLPVFIVNQMDCTAVYAKPDSIFLQQLVAQLPDSLSAQELPLKVNTAYQTVSWLLNYPLLLIISGIVLVVIIVLWIIFGKRIRRYFVLRKLNRNHAKFILDFEGMIEELQNNYSRQRAESALILWKKYMEGLESNPYTKFTTKEIFQLVKDETLATALRQIDKNIYRESEALAKDPLLELRQYTEKQFHHRLEELRNG